MRVRLPAQELAPGLTLLSLTMEVPAEGASLDPARGAAQYRHVLCDLVELELEVAEPALPALLARLGAGAEGGAERELALRAGFAEARGRLEDGAPATFQLIPLAAPGPAELALRVHASRVWPEQGRWPAHPSPRELAASLARLIGGSRCLGPSLIVNPLPALLRRLLPPLGWKVPLLGAARLAEARVTSGELLLRWERGAEGLVAAGIEALGAGRPEEEPARRSEPDELLASARSALGGGEAAQAAEALTSAAEALLRRGEESAALAAAGSALSLAGESGASPAPPAFLRRAVDLVLALQRSHLGALRALRALGAQGDLASLLRACRRLAAYAPSAEERASAHAELGELLREEDLAASRLHLDQALRLAPSDREVLTRLARAFDAAGDPGRARELVERLRAAAVERGDAPSAAEAALDLAERARAAGDLSEASRRLRDAQSLGLAREDALAAWSALAGRAAEADEAVAEREALTEAVLLLPVGARPAALLRLSTLALAASDPLAARQQAEAARALAPRDVRALEACRTAALAQGDEQAIPALLAALAALVPERRGALQLDRARRLASLGRALEADDAFTEALDAMPPCLDLARALARARRVGEPDLRARSWSAPLEHFAARADGDEVGGALLEAARLAEAQGHLGTALRCARGALARAPGDLAGAGVVLARLLYLQGSGFEALDLLRRLFEAGVAGPASQDEGASGAEVAALFAERVDPAEPLRALAELAESEGDTALARAALDRLVALAPGDLQAALRRAELDPDRARAARSLAEAAPQMPGARAAALGLAVAAALARGGGQDREETAPLTSAALEALDRLAAVAGGAAVDRVLEEVASRDAEGALALALRRAESVPEAGDRRPAWARAAELASRCDDRGPDAATALEALASIDLERGAAGADALVERALVALARGGRTRGWEP